MVGNGKGVSIFVGLDKENFMYIAQGGVVDHKIQGRTRMQFRMGEEVMVVPYGCLHAH